MGSFDRPGQPGEPERPDDHGKSGSDSPGDAGDLDRSGTPQESESSRAERLGLSTLTREDVWRTQRSLAEAQEAALARSDSAGPRGQADPGPVTAVDAGVPAGRETPGPELGRERDTPAGGADRWGPHRPEDHPATNVEAPGRYYWTEVPRFLTMWREHVTQWPGVGRDQAGSPLDPELRAKAVESIKIVPDAEPPISGNIERVEAENTNHGWLEGFDFRLKGQDRLMEKIADKLAAEPERAPMDAVREIPDAIRYTFCFDRDVYTQGYWDVKGRLEGCGYEMYHCKNWWTSPEYKGVNTRWITPEGQRFEVQFHTRESFHAKHQVTHQAYERGRSPLTGRAELAEIENFQREVSSWIPVPDRVERIPDYKKEDT